MTDSEHCRYCGSTEMSLAVAAMRDWEYGVEGSYDYLECRACRGVQLSPFPGLDDLKKAYDIDYHGYADKDHRGGLFSVLYGLKEKLLYRRIAALVPSRSPNRKSPAPQPISSRRRP